MAEAPSPTGPNQIWVQDITYIQTKEGWLYLAAILDLYSRKIAGWAMSSFIDTALVLEALAMALLHRDPPLDLLCHSDRGVQYASAAYRAALATAGVITSMSRKGNCYDNAFIESFWSTLKLELVYRRNFAARQEAQSAIFDYIECFYNRQRSHTALDGLSPVDFETKNKQTAAATLCKLLGRSLFLNFWSELTHCGSADCKSILTITPKKIRSEVLE